jgi:competence protein ComEA
VGGIVLAAALVVLSMPHAETARPGACAAPREAESRGGHSVSVDCGEGPAKRAGGGTDLRGPARILFGIPLDLASADAATLEVLPGVGPSLAAAIVRERSARPFAAPRDLARVPGIGARKVARLTPWFDTGDR